jgi:hypothetical protein
VSGARNGENAFSRLIPATAVLPKTHTYRHFSIDMRRDGDILNPTSLEPNSLYPFLQFFIFKMMLAVLNG